MKFRSYHGAFPPVLGTTRGVGAFADITQSCKTSRSIRESPSDYIDVQPYGAEKWDSVSGCRVKGRAVRVFEDLRPCGRVCQRTTLV